MLPIILFTLVILLAFTSFFLVTRLQNSKKRFLKLEQEASLGSFLGSLLQETAKPLAAIQETFKLIQSSIAYLQEIVIRLRMKTTLTVEEVSLLEKSLGEESLEAVMTRMDTMVDHLENLVGRAQKALEEVRHFSTTEADQPEPVKLPNLVQKALHYLGPQMEGRIEVHLDLATLPPLNLRGGLLFQLLYRLMTLTIEAMPEGGHLRLSLKSEKAHAVLGVQGEAEVLPSVRDWDLLKSMAKDLKIKLRHESLLKQNRFWLHFPQA